MKKYLTILIVLFLSSDVLSEDKTISNEFEAKIIALSLERSYEDGGYTIVTPQTKLSNIDYTNVEDIKESKEYIKKEFKHILKGYGYNIPANLDNLFNKNENPVRLNLKSEPSKGYLIDYEGKYEKYFVDGGGWDKLYTDNPKAHGFTTVSRPAYDKKNCIVLIFKGIRVHWLAGVGFIIAYEFKDNKLRELGRVRLWIS